MKPPLILALALLAASLPAQTPKPAPPVVTVEQPDAQRTRQEFSQLLDRYPPTLRALFAIDPSLLENQAFLAPYPGVVNFLTAHPEVARTPSFYIESHNFNNYDRRQAQESTAERLWTRIIEDLSIFAGFGLAIGVATWLIRTLIDYRRWSRLSKVQTDVHTKLLDRFTGHEDLLAYIQSPAGAKFLESSPIALDPGPRSVGAPLGRILWSVQAGLVSMAGGVGLQVVAGRFNDDAGQPLHAFGVLGVALGLGFVISAIISFLISHRLGLIDPPVRPAEPPPARG